MQERQMSQPTEVDEIGPPRVANLSLNKAEHHLEQLLLALQRFCVDDNGGEQEDPQSVSERSSTWTYDAAAGPLIQTRHGSCSSTSSEVPGPTYCSSHLSAEETQAGTPSSDDCAEIEPQNRSLVAGQLLDAPESAKADADGGDFCCQDEEKLLLLQELLPCNGGFAKKVPLPQGDADSEEVAELRKQLSNRERQLLEATAHLNDAQEAAGTFQSRCIELQRHLATMRNDSHNSMQKCEEEVSKLQQALNIQVQEVQQVEMQRERDVVDSAHFLQRLARSSAGSALHALCDLDTMEVLGMGNYGYILLCKSNMSGDTLVVKAQSLRWVPVAVKEWSHGTDLGEHPNIVEYTEVLMHRDSDKKLERKLVAAFDDGILDGRRPRQFPGCYICLVLEYMDHGSVQDLMREQPLNTESVGAISRQVASALAFMHRMKRTHNDVKPDNILLKRSSADGSLITKLADFGLAEHSLDRQRDRDLFAYTVWCMGLNQCFARCPATCDQRTRAVAEFLTGLQHDIDETGKVWQPLAAVIEGLWAGKLEMVEIEDLRELQRCQLRVPSGLEAATRARVHQQSIDAASTLAPHSPSSDSCMEGTRRHSAVRFRVDMASLHSSPRTHQEPESGNPSRRDLRSLSLSWSEIADSDDMEGN